MKTKSTLCLIAALAVWGCAKSEDTKTGPGSDAIGTTDTPSGDAVGTADPGPSGADPGGTTGDTKPPTDLATPDTGADVPLITPDTTTDAGTDAAPDDIAATDTTDTGADTATPVDPCAAQGKLPKGCFATPTAVTSLAQQGLVLVGNANLDASFVAGQGFVTVVDAKKEEVVFRYATARENPASFVVDGDTVYLVESGATTYDVGAGAVVSTGPGAVEFGPIGGDLANIKKVEIANDPKNPAVGAPAIAVLVKGMLYLGSFTGGILFKIDVAKEMAVNDATNPIWIDKTAGPHQTVPAVGPNGLIYVVDPNTDLLHVVDPSTDAVDAVATKAPYKLSNAVAPASALVDRIAWVSSTLLVAKGAVSNALSTFDLTAGTVTVGVAEIGGFSNGVSTLDGVFYVTQSKDGTIGAYDVVGKTFNKAAVTLAGGAGANPWALAVDKGASGPVGWVVNFNTHELVKVDLTSGKTLVTLAP